MLFIKMLVKLEPNIAFGKLANWGVGPIFRLFLDQFRYLSLENLGENRGGRSSRVV